MTTVESLWTAARNFHGQFGDRRRPSVGITAVLLALYENGSSYGSEIAAENGQDQGNVARWLVKLKAFGFVDVVDERPGYGNQGGGKPAVFWALTRDGRELAGLLVNEDTEEAPNGRRRAA